MKIFLVILGVIMYGFFLCYRMLIEGTDEYIDKSMERAYKLAETLENKNVGG